MYPYIVALHVHFSYYHFKSILAYFLSSQYLVMLWFFLELWLSDKHVVFQHILHRSHLRSNRIGLVSICVAIVPVYLWNHSILIFPISVLAVFLQELQTGVIRSSNYGFQNTPNLCVLIWLGCIH